MAAQLPLEPDPFDCFMSAVRNLQPHGSVPWVPPLQRFCRTYIEKDVERLIEIVRLLGWQQEMEVSRRDGDYVLRVKGKLLI